MQDGRYDDLEKSRTWAPRIAAVLCGLPAAMSLYAHLETGRLDWLITGALLAGLALGVARRHRTSLRWTATLLMSIGVSMPVGAASPLAAMDARSEPWITGSVAAGICSWLAISVLLIVLGWQLEHVRRVAEPAQN